MELIIGIIASIIATIIIKIAYNNRDKILYFISQKKTITKIFDDINDNIINGKNINSRNHKKLFLKIFKKKSIDKKYIQNLNEKLSSIFLLGLQFYYKELKISDNVTINELTYLADKATECDKYKRILLNLSFSYFNFENRKQLIDRIMKKSTLIQVGFKFNEANNKLINFLKHIEKDNLYIFSTTSQISNFQLDIFNSKKEDINELNLFMVSPLIKSHKALLNLKDEYDVPKFTIPKLQFISKNYDFDLFRRVIKILQAIDKLYLLKKNTHINCNLYLFKEKYPDIKIILLKKNRYLQLFPNPLKFVNNIYRFGLEITDNELVDDIYNILINDIIEDDKKLHKIEINQYNIEQLKKDAINEIYWYLIRNNQDIETLDNYRTDFNLILKDNNIDIYIDEMLSLHNKLQNYSHKYAFSDNKSNVDIYKRVEYDKVDKTNNIVIKNVNNIEAHISVGVIFFDENNKNILLITKKQHPYKNKRSIIAGHLEKGESPYDAIKREVKEEIGIEINDFTLLKHYEIIKGDICRYDNHNHIWYLFLSNTIIDIEKIKVSDIEISGIDWYRIENLKETNEFTYATKYMFEDLSLI